MTGWVGELNRVIVTIRKHICSKKALTCACIVIRVDESVIHRVIIAALQIVESGFRIVVIATVAKRIRICHAASGRQEVAPCVVGVRRCFRTAGRYQLDHIALQIQDIVICGKAAAAIVPDSI
jgi:hypothetical protein